MADKELITKAVSDYAFKLHHAYQDNLDQIMRIVPVSASAVQLDPTNEREPVFASPKFFIGDGPQTIYSWIYLLSISYLFQSFKKLNFTNTESNFRLFFSAWSLFDLDLLAKNSQSSVEEIESISTPKDWASAVHWANMSFFVRPAGVDNLSDLDTSNWAAVPVVMDFDVSSDQLEFNLFVRTGKSKMYLLDDEHYSVDLPSASNLMHVMHHSSELRRKMFDPSPDPLYQTAIQFRNWLSSEQFDKVIGKLFYVGTATELQEMIPTTVNRSYRGSSSWNSAASVTFVPPMTIGEVY